MLSVEGINQYYGGSHILRDVAFEARLGEVTVVLGRNGVGKTTLLKSLMGVVTVKTGSDSTELTIAPETAVEPPCQSGCTVELENGEQYEMKGGEEASIESGVIFVDAAPGAEDDEATGATGQGEPTDAAPEDSAAAPSEDAPQAQ